MVTIDKTQEHGLATITLEHGKVNALRPDVVEALDAALSEIEHDDTVEMVLLTGRGAFFSFGFDVPHFLGYERDDFGRFLLAFTRLYTRLFLVPKPVIGAINGHAVAGGWMLAQPCDARVLVRGRTKVGLNEVRFGASLFAGSIEILRHLAGGRVTDLAAGSGAFFAPDRALALGLVDDLCDADDLAVRAAELAALRYGEVTQPSFGEIKKLIRQPIVDGYREREAHSIERFLDIWYAPAVQESLKEITIRA